MTNLVSGVQ